MRTTYYLEQPKTNSISTLRHLLGASVVLLPCIGKRPVDKGWQQRGLRAMSNPTYLQRLQASANIGVALGKQSSGLCVVDFDTEGADETFLALNPSLNDTLRTRGRRGSSFWLRIIGDFPSSKTLGDGLGEWRASGNQSIIAGIHPETRKPYRFLNKARPVEIAFDEIVWPNGMSFGQTSSVKNTPDHNTAIFGKSDLSEKRIIKLCRARRSRTSNRRLFQLARGVLTLERQRGESLAEADLQRIFSDWYQLSLPYLRPGRAREKYFQEFLEKCDCACQPLDENSLKVAWEKAKTTPLPEAAALLRSQAAKRLLALSWQLQILAGDGPFFVSCYDSARLLEITPQHSAGMMRKFSDLKILRVVEAGHEGRATRYRFAEPPKPKTITI